MKLSGCSEKMIRVNLSSLISRKDLREKLILADPWHISC